MSPRAFTEQEKGVIQKKLMDAAEDALSTTGIRKTTVEDLAKAAGISKGAFYLFYDSKELLFLDALEREQERIHNTMIERIRERAIGPKVFTEVVGQMYRDFVAKPWLLAFAGEEYEILLRRIPPERIQRHIQMDDEASRRFLEALGRGTMVEPELLSASLRMLFMGILHRKEVGEEWADEAFTLMLMALADRIFEEET